MGWGEVIAVAPSFPRPRNFPETSLDTRSLPATYTVAMQAGDVHGYLVVVARTENRYRREVLWLCRCTECGLDKLLRARQITGEKRAVCPHRPKQDHPLYNSWRGMRERCYHKNHRKFRLYGARGIRVCERWRRDFWAFVADVGPRPSARHSLDRIDVNGDYCPENCRWATHAEQSRNRTDNVIVEYQGKRVLFCDLPRSSSVSMELARARWRHGWPLDKALTRAPRLYRRKPNGLAQADLPDHRPSTEPVEAVGLGAGADVVRSS